MPWTHDSHGLIIWFCNLLRFKLEGGLKKEEHRQSILLCRKSWKSIENHIRQCNRCWLIWSRNLYRCRNNKSIKVCCWQSILINACWKGSALHTPRWTCVQQSCVLNFFICVSSSYILLFTYIYILIWYLIYIIRYVLKYIINNIQYHFHQHLLSKSPKWFFHKVPSVRGEKAKVELSSLNEAKTFGEKFQREKKAGTKQQDNQGSLNYHTLPIFFFLGGGGWGTKPMQMYVM